MEKSKSDTTQREGVLSTADWVDLCLMIIQRRRSSYTTLDFDEVEVLEKTLLRVKDEIEHA